MSSTQSKTNATTSYFMSENATIDFINAHIKAYIEAHIKLQLDTMHDKFDVVG